MIAFIKVEAGTYESTAEQYFVSDMPVKKELFMWKIFILWTFLWSRGIR